MVFSVLWNLSYTDEAVPAIIDRAERSERYHTMRKWLIILAVIIVAIIGVLWWLGQSLEADKPEPGEVRMEIEHVL